MSDGASSASMAAHLYLPESEPSFRQSQVLSVTLHAPAADPTSSFGNSALKLPCVEGLVLPRSSNVTNEDSFKTPTAPSIDAVYRDTSLPPPHRSLIP